MTELPRRTVPKWPFFAADAFMLGMAWFVYAQSHAPLESFALGTLCACVAIGALFAVLPYVLEYQLVLKAAESESLTSAVQQVQNLQEIASQISLATGQWQTVNDHSSKAVTAAAEIGEKMAVEARAFGEFMQKANDAEKSNLRLEVDKLRRGEAEWVQVVVRMLDHTFALHAAAVRSGKTAIVEQLSQFQNAQRDAARRVGLNPFVARPGDPFDPQKHQPSESGEPDVAAEVEDTLATGYTLRGQLVRHALVAIRRPEAPELRASEEEAIATQSPSEQPQEQTLL